MRLHKAVSAALAAYLTLTFSVGQVVATDNDDRRWDPQQWDKYNYSPCYYFEADFPAGDARSRISNGRSLWNSVGRELWFGNRAPCSHATHAAIKVNWNDLLVPFNDDWAFVNNDHLGDISDSTVNFNASPDKSGGGVWSWYWGTGEPTGKVDGWSVAGHEFGHAVALGHTEQSTSDLMYPYINVGQKKRALTAHDKASIGALYAVAR